MREVDQELFDAAKQGNLDRVKRCLNQGANIHVEHDGWYKRGYTPLYFAAERGQLEVVKFLVDKGASIKGTCAIKPIHPAIYKGHINVIEFFLNKGISINGTTDTLLHCAAGYGQLGVVKFLVDKGANVHTKDNTGKKPIHFAARGGHKNIIEFFLGKGVRVNDTDESGYTPLHAAASSGQSEVIKFLVSKGANVHAKTILDGKPIKHAIIGEHKSVIEFFLSKGVSVNDTDRYGNTLLHHVVDSGKKLFDDGKKLEIVRLLIDKGANIYARNNNGRIPSDLARERGHMEIVNTLGSAENKSQLSKTTRGTDGKPEPYLSGITISNQPMRTRAPGN